jgi:argininosuccinate synthase
MESDASVYDQNDATGFIRLNALRLKLRSQRKQTDGSQ